MEIIIVYEKFYHCEFKSYFFMKEVLFTSGFKSINFRLLFLQLLKENNKIM